jgi:hypothetical protein
MATYALQGGPWNGSLITALLLTDSAGNAYNLLPYLNGDIALVPAKQAMVRAMARENAVATVPGQVSDGSITIPLLMTALVDTTTAGYGALYQALAQDGTGTAFAPFTSATMSTFDGDTAEDYIFDARAKAYKVTIVCRAQSSAALGQRIDVYAEFATPDLTMANAGGVNALSLVGALPRRGCISLATS